MKHKIIGMFAAVLLFAVAADATHAHRSVVAFNDRSSTAGWQYMGSTTIATITWYRYTCVAPNQSGCSLTDQISTTELNNLSHYPSSMAPTGGGTTAPTWATPTYFRDQLISDATANGWTLPSPVPYPTVEHYESGIN